MVFIMVGIPASGKSTIAAAIAKEFDAVIVESDDIRERRFGKPNFTKAENAYVFDEVHRRIAKAIADGKNVIVDATNIYKRSRTDALAAATKAGRTYAIHCDTPTDICLKRNKGRKREVPDAVIRRMTHQLTTPSVSEGFTAVFTTYGNIERIIAEIKLAEAGDNSGC